MKPQSSGSVLPVTIDMPLMTGPLVTTTTTANKEQHYLLNEVEQKLEDLRQEEAYELRKSRIAIFCLLTSIAAILLLFFGLGYTVLFESDKPGGSVSYAVFACSGFLFLPFAYWVKFLCFPNAQERERRKYMHAKRRERVDEQARVTKENLRLARIEDAKREAAKKELQEKEDEDLKASNRRSTSGY